MHAIDSRAKISDLDRGLRDALNTLPSSQEFQKVRDFSTQIVGLLKDQRAATAMYTRRVDFLTKRVAGDAQLLEHLAITSGVLLGAWIGAGGAVTIAYIAKVKGIKVVFLSIAGVSLGGSIGFWEGCKFAATHLNKKNFEYSAHCQRENEDHSNSALRRRTLRARAQNSME